MTVSSGTYRLCGWQARFLQRGRWEGFFSSMLKHSAEALQYAVFTVLIYGTDATQVSGLKT